MIGNNIGSPIGGIVRRGSQNFDQSVTASASSSVLQALVISRAVAAQANAAVSLARDSAFTVTANVPVTITALKAVTYAVAASAFTATGSVTRGVSKPLTSGVNVAASAVRQLGKGVTSGITAATALGDRVVAFAVDTLASAAVSLAKAVSLARAAQFVASAGLSISNVVVVLANIAVSGSIVADAIRKAVRYAVATVGGAFGPRGLLRAGTDSSSVTGASRNGDPVKSGTGGSSVSIGARGQTEVE